MESDTIRNLLSEFLKKSGFEISCAKNGIEAMEIFFREMPDCVIVSTELSFVSGYDFSRAIRKTEELKNTVIILCSADKVAESKIWSENFGVDGFYVPSPENLHVLYNTILSSGEKYGESKSAYNQNVSEKDIIQLLTKTFGEEFFELYMIKNAFKAKSYVLDVEQFLENIKNSLRGIFNYDALGIIIDDNPLVEFYDHSDNLSEADFTDFRKICQDDFESRNPNRRDFNWKKSTMFESLEEDEMNQNLKLENYEIFPSDPYAGFPLTIHVASSGIKNISGTVKKRIDFVAGLYSPVVEKNILLKKSTDAEKKMKAAFSRFLPSKVIDRIVNGGTFVDLSIGERRKVAILISDIRNFTRISEINEPEAVVSFLNRYFSRMGEIIKKHGGTIDKFMGDGIMALFGVPESFNYNGFRAANAAVEMMQEVEHMDTSGLTLPDGISFKVGIGIHYGTPIAGTFGSEEKKEYTVIGDDVNLACRIENLTKVYGTPILVTDSVKKDIEDALADAEEEPYLPQNFDYDLRHLDNVKVLGKTVPVSIYEINWNKEKYSANFLENYRKGLYQYVVGNFFGAQDYLRIAKILNPNDLSTKVLLERCKNFSAERPQNWDGSVTLTSK